MLDARFRVPTELLRHCLPQHRFLVTWVKRNHTCVRKPTPRHPADPITFSRVALEEEDVTRLGLIDDLTDWKARVLRIVAQVV